MRGPGQSQHDQVSALTKLDTDAKTAQIPRPAVPPPDLNG